MAKELMGERRCSVDGCERLWRALEFCNMHYRRLRRTGEVGGPNPLPRRVVKVTRCLTSHGYIRVYRPGHPMAKDRNWAAEHRVVAYDAGLLEGPEDSRHVHHRNRDKTDNRLSNLEVVDSHEHGVRHRTVDWERAAKMYEGGLTMVQIADELGTNNGGVSRRLREMGVSIRPPKRTPIDEEAVIRLHREGMRSSRIAATLGASVEVVRGVLRRRGVGLWPPGRPPGLPSDQARDVAGVG